jgi:hypothetical protein
LFKLKNLIEKLNRPPIIKSNKKVYISHLILDLKHQVGKGNTLGHVLSGVADKEE